MSCPLRVQKRWQPEARYICLQLRVSILVVQCGYGGPRKRRMVVHSLLLACSCALRAHPDSPDPRSFRTGRQRATHAAEQQRPRCAQHYDGRNGCGSPARWWNHSADCCSRGSVIQLRAGGPHQHPQPWFTPRTLPRDSEKTSMTPLPGADSTTPFQFRRLGKLVHHCRLGTPMSAFFASGMAFVPLWQSSVCWLWHVSEALGA